MGKIAAGANGDDAQRTRLAATRGGHQAVDHFVSRAVPTSGDDELKSIADRLLSQLGRMPNSGSLHQLKAQSNSLQIAA
jgi:hypothetical protein